jgi:protease-4
MKAATHKWIAVGILLGIIFLGIIVIAAAAGIGGGGGSAGRLPFKRLAVVRIEGAITESAWHVGLLREYLNNRNVAGVLLRIDSPGGAVAPAQEIYNEVAAYREAGKPLVVSMGNVAASGGYYIAAPAHKIFAAPGTLTGSIGVIFTAPMYQELAKKVGIDFRVLKAGDLKDAGSPFRPMTETEKAYWQTMLNDVHEQFIEDVATGRGVDVSEIRAVADGRVFTGRQAYENGLVDTLGGYADALRYLGMLCGIPENTKPIERRQSMGLRELFMETAGKVAPGLESAFRPAGLYYLFVP